MQNRDAAYLLMRMALGSGALCFSNESDDCESCTLRWVPPFLSTRPVSSSSSSSASSSEL